MNNLLYFSISITTFDIYQSSIKAMQFIYNIVHKRNTFDDHTNFTKLYMKHTLTGSYKV